MKIAIHHRNGSFSDEWIKFCEQEKIPYKLVNAFDSDIINQVSDCKIFMWHHHHARFQDVLVAKQILFALEQAGKKVFPDFKTGWHFDDKVAQKYLLESIDAPLIPSFVFYAKQDAAAWIEKTSFPKVFKLRGGAGATNVKLIHNKTQANQLINRAFGRGFSQFNRLDHFKETLRKLKEGKESKISLLKGIARIFFPTEFVRMQPREKGYIYFQEFIPNNSFDIRLIVIGGKYAYGVRRLNRKDDFRASGSSNFRYDEIPDKVVKEAFETSLKLNLKSCAFDFIFDKAGTPLIIEMSYGFGTTGSGKAPGYWTSDLCWHEEAFNPHAWMVKDLINELKIM